MALQIGVFESRNGNVTGDDGSSSKPFRGFAALTVIPKGLTGKGIPSIVQIQDGVFPPSAEPKFTDVSTSPGAPLTLDFGQPPIAYGSVTINLVDDATGEKATSTFWVAAKDFVNP